MREAFSFLLDNIYIRFGSKLYRQIVGIPMGNNCAPLVVDLFFFFYFFFVCYERDLIGSVSGVFLPTFSSCLFQMLTNLKLLKLSILFLGI